MPVVEVQIRFISKQVEFAVPNFPLSVPGSVTTRELNTLINELLKETNDSHKPIQFDILIQNEFLRATLAEHIGERGISLENVIDVEYLERFPPPEPQDCLLHEDWISAIAANERWILTGCYDKTLHIWSIKGKHHLAIPAHKKPIKAVAWISMDGENASFVSTSMDETARIWHWNIPSNHIECARVCRGHERSVQTVSVNCNQTLLATGSWDGLIKIWSTSDIDDMGEEEISAKRMKYLDERIRIPKRTIKGHRDAVSGVVWSDKTEIISSSWDHTLKIWDSELGGIKHEIIGHKSFFDVDYSPLSNAIITSSPDRHVFLYDPRSTDGTVVKLKFASHKEAVVTVRWSKINEYLFISGSYDNTVKVWDTRSPKAPLFNLTGHEEDVLCCSWSNPKFIVSGGADKTVRIFKSKHVAS